MDLVGNRSCSLSTGNNKRSRQRCLKNGIPQGSALAPFLFNIYTSDLTTTVSSKYAWLHTLTIGLTDHLKFFKGYFVFQRNTVGYFHTFMLSAFVPLPGNWTKNQNISRKSEVSILIPFI